MISLPLFMSPSCQVSPPQCEVMTVFLACNIWIVGLLREAVRAVISDAGPQRYQGSFYFLTLLGQQVTGSPRRAIKLVQNGARSIQHGWHDTITEGGVKSLGESKTILPRPNKWVNLWAANRHIFIIINLNGVHTHSLPYTYTQPSQPPGKWPCHSQSH